VAHAYNPSYSESRGKEDHSSKPPPHETLSRETPSREKGWWSGSSHKNTFLASVRPWVQTPKKNSDKSPNGLKYSQIICRLNSEHFLNCQCKGKFLKAKKEKFYFSSLVLETRGWNLHKPSGGGDIAVRVLCPGHLICIIAVLNHVHNKLLLWAGVESSCLHKPKNRSAHKVGFIRERKSCR
jgi:hypothetical protein